MRIPSLVCLLLMIAAPLLFCTSSLDAQTVQPGFAKCDWDAAQSGWQKLRTTNWLDESAYVLELVPFRERLQALTVDYGPDATLRCWPDKVQLPKQYQALDLRDEAASAAYLSYRASLPDTEQAALPLFAETTLSELLARVQAVLGLGLDDVEALQAAVTWADEYLLQKHAGQLAGQDIPDFYGPCKQHLARLEWVAEIVKLPVRSLPEFFALELAADPRLDEMITELEAVKSEFGGGLKAMWTEEPLTRGYNYSGHKKLSVDYLLACAVGARGIKHLSTADLQAAFDYFNPKNPDQAIEILPRGYWEWGGALLRLEAGFVPRLVTEDDWHSMQECWRIELAFFKGYLTEIEALRLARARLALLIARYSGEQLLRCWEPSIPLTAELASLNLRDDAAVMAWRRSTDEMPASAHSALPILAEEPLFELMARLQNHIGLAENDADALRYAVVWAEEYTARQRAIPEPAGHFGPWHYPHIYEPCKQRLTELLAGGARLAPAAFTLYGQFPLVEAEGRYFLPLDSLPLPLDRLEGSAESRTVRLALPTPVSLTVGVKRAFVGKKSVTLTAAPLLRDSELYLAARDLPLLGVNFRWDPALNALRVTLGRP